jgi:hypothetical protein
MPKTRRNLKKGGGSTSEYGTYVWGTGNQQHAVGNGSNLIAAVNDPTTYKGGKGGARKSAKKGGNLVNIAVPAVLIAANQLYKPKRAFRETKKGGSATSVSDLAGIMKNLQDTAANSLNPTPTPIPTLVKVDQLPNATAAVLKGGNIGEEPAVIVNPPETIVAQPSQQPLVVGSGILTDIAAPAILIAANQLYKPSKRTTRKNKRSNGRKSLRL